MRKANAKTTITAAPTITQEHTEHTVAYIHGRIEAQLEGFAASLGLPARQLTVRVAALLLGPESGSLLGGEDRVPTLPRTSTTARKATRKMAVAKRPYRKTRGSRLRGGAAYWAKMTPGQRSKEMQRRMKKRQSKTVTAAITAA